MLPRLYRLTKRGDFERVFRKGKSSSSFLCTMRWMPNGLHHPRFGFVVSNKISKKAVVRNRIKRRLREIARERTLPFPNDDVVIIAKHGMVDADFSLMEKTVHGLFEKYIRGTRDTHTASVPKNPLPRP